MDYEAIKQEVLQIARDDRSCVPGFKDALNAQNFGQMVAVWKKYWEDVAGQMHFSRTIQFLEKHYAVHREEFRQFGLVYNEAANSGIILVNNADVLGIMGNPSVFVFGDSTVEVMEKSEVRAENKGTTVILRGGSYGAINGQATVKAYDRSRVFASGNAVVYSLGAVTIYSGNDVHVYAKSWDRITAGGNSVVHAFSSRKISLVEQAKLIIE